MKGYSQGRRRLIREYAEGTFFVLPFMLLFFVFVIIPVVISAVLSLCEYDIIRPPSFVGLENYKQLFLDDDVFGICVRNTLLFAFIAGPIGLVASFLLAWVINQMKFRNLFAIAFYAPSITSGIAMSTVWQYIFSPNRYGLVNNFLINIGIISTPILWNQDSRYLLGVIILIHVWMSMGNGFLVFLAGLQNVNKEYYEAAAVDGVSTKLQQLIYITLPQMKPQLLFGCINAITASFAVFDISAGFAGIPTPNYAADTIVSHLYDFAFIRFEMGYASAIAVVLFVVTFTLSRVVMRALSEKE